MPVDLDRLREALLSRYPFDLAATRPFVRQEATAAPRRGCPDARSGRKSFEERRRTTQPDRIAGARDPECGRRRNRIAEVFRHIGSG